MNSKTHPGGAEKTKRTRLRSCVMKKILKKDDRELAHIKLVSTQVTLLSTQF
ncbi:hypothetical protein HZA42_03375 [Candidatus Peregrinibacteria bacterium]|nr:hypothetical protein [Candidatus Peregrinibacteria bacterium]